MKTLIAFILLSTSCFAQQQIRQAVPRATALLGVPGRYKSIITNSLVYYREVQVMSTTATEIVFTHEEGMVRANLADMPTEIQRAYNFDPLITMDPVVQAQKKKDRDDAVAIIAKNPTKARVVVSAVRPDAAICSVYLPMMEKSNKRTFSGEYIMKEVISKEPKRTLIVDAIGKPPGHDFGVVPIYPCGTHSFYGQMYALDPSKAYDAINQATPKP